MLCALHTACCLSRAARSPAAVQNGSGTVSTAAAAGAHGVSSLITVVVVIVDLLGWARTPAVSIGVAKVSPGPVRMCRA